VDRRSQKLESVVTSFQFSSVLFCPFICAPDKIVGHSFESVPES
jgi:hypothetical protein